MSSEQASVGSTNNSHSATSVGSTNNSVIADSVETTNNSLSATSAGSIFKFDSLLDLSASDFNKLLTTGGKIYISSGYSTNSDFYTLDLHVPTYDIELSHDEIVAAVVRSEAVICELLVNDAKGRFIPTRTHKYNLKPKKFCDSCEVYTNDTVHLLVFGQQICMKCYNMGKKMFSARVSALIEGESFEKEDFNVLSDAHGDALGDAPVMHSVMHSVMQLMPM